MKDLLTLALIIASVGAFGYSIHFCQVFLKTRRRDKMLAKLLAKLTATTWRRYK